MNRSTKYAMKCLIARQEAVAKATNMPIPDVLLANRESALEYAITGETNSPEYIGCIGIDCNDCGWGNCRTPQNYTDPKLIQLKQIK